MKYCCGKKRRGSEGTERDLVWARISVYVIKIESACVCSRGEGK